MRFDISVEILLRNSLKTDIQTINFWKNRKVASSVLGYSTLKTLYPASINADV